MTALHFYVSARVWDQFVAAAGDLASIRTDGRVICGDMTAFDSEGVLPAVTAERLLDKHWLVFATGDLEGQQNVEHAMFNSIADTYETAINDGRNRINGVELLRAAEIKKGARILDFGCGPGLLAETIEGYEIVGCDSSSAMRAAARSRGLSVMSPVELQRSGQEFDVVICSYVLHLAVADSDLAAAFNALRPEGRLAANFHKSKGLARVESFAASQRDLCAESTKSIDATSHGPIRVWRRIG